GTDYVWRTTPLDVAASPLFQIRGSQYKKGVARIVMQLDRKVGYAIREDDAGLAIVIPTASQAKAPANAATSTALAGMADKPANVDSTTPDRLPVVKRLAQVRVAQAPARPAAATTTVAANLGGAVAQAAPNTPPAPVTSAPADGQRLISLDFKDADVVNLLRILAAESGRNIVIGDDVKGKMSISLRNVAWDLALDTIMEARGL